MTSPTPYQLLPRLTNDEYEALKNDIADNGIRVPIDVDENGTILDGHHRAWITADLGIECPRRTIAGLSEEQKRTHAVAVNVHRRSLTREQRRELVARLRADGLSVRRIAEATGINRETVRRDAGDTSVSPDRVIGADGKSYAATRPAAGPTDSGLLAGDEWIQREDVDADFDEVLDASSLGAPYVQAATEPIPEHVREQLARATKRRPLPEAFTDAGRDYVRAAERLARLTEDDRFARNRETTHHQVPELLGALDHTTRLIQAMRLDQATASEEARRWWATSLHKISDALTDVANSIEQDKK